MAAHDHTALMLSGVQSESRTGFDQRVLEVGSRKASGLQQTPGIPGCLSVLQVSPLPLVGLEAGGCSRGHMEAPGAWNEAEALPCSELFSKATLNFDLLVRPPHKKRLIIMFPDCFMFYYIKGKIKL